MVTSALIRTGLDLCLVYSISIMWLHTKIVLLFGTAAYLYIKEFANMFLFYTVTFDFYCVLQQVTYLIRTLGLQQVFALRFIL